MSWQILAVISALAAGATSVLAKVGLEDVPSNLANAVRTAIVLVLSIGVVLFTGEHKAATTKLDGHAWPLERRPLTLETSMPGVLAAGDVRHASVKRVASAVGAGAIAVPMVAVRFNASQPVCGRYV